MEWSSSDPSVVSVDENGKILALKKGVATITVKTESGLEATSNITVESLLVPTDISKPDLAGYNFAHPQSLTRITMKMRVEHEMSDAKLTMKIPNVGLLFSSVKAVKLNGNTPSFWEATDKSITINLDNLTGSIEYPGTYNLEVYVKMEPTPGLNIGNYNERVNAKEKLIVSNELKALIDVGETELEETTFELEPYNLELMKIPKIN